MVFHTSKCKRVFTEWRCDDDVTGVNGSEEFHGSARDGNADPEMIVHVAAESPEEVRVALRRGEGGKSMNHQMKNVLS